MALVPQMRANDSIWSNTIVDPSQPMERGQSWPQTTVTEQQHELDEAIASRKETRICHCRTITAYRTAASDHRRQSYNVSLEFHRLRNPQTQP